MTLFNFCAVCDDVRLELENKGSLVGFYGMLPHVEINVQHPTLPLLKLAFLLISGTPVPAGKYRVRLSLKSPDGKELLPQTDAVTADIGGAGPLNAVIICQPFPLAGFGEYRVAAIVNDKEDFVGALRVSQGPPTQ